MLSERTTIPSVALILSNASIMGNGNCQWARPFGPPLGGWEPCALPPHISSQSLTHLQWFEALYFFTGQLLPRQLAAEAPCSSPLPKQVNSSQFSITRDLSPSLSWFVHVTVKKLPLQGRRKSSHRQTFLLLGTSIFAQLNALVWQQSVVKFLVVNPVRMNSWNCSNI